MLDTLSVAQELTAGGIDRDQAEVIANAMRKLAQQGDHVTGDQFKAGLAEVRTEIAALDTRLSTQIAGVRTEIAEVRTEISTLETRLVRWDGRDRARDGGADVWNPEVPRRVSRASSATAIRSGSPCRAAAR